MAKLLSSKSITWYITPGLIFVIIVGFLLWNYSQFQPFISRDNGVYLYGGQQLASGHLPYNSILDYKGPLSSMVIGGLVFVGRTFNTPDLAAARIGFLVLTALTCVVIYYLTTSLFQDARAGFLSAFVYISFNEIFFQAVGGPRPKTLMVALMATALLLAVYRRTFWASLCGTLAALTWQVSGIIPIWLGVLALVSTTEQRWRSLVPIALGVIIPHALIMLIYLLDGTLSRFLEGYLLFLLYLDRGDQSAIENYFTTLNRYGPAMLTYAFGLLTYLYVCGHQFWQTRPWRTIAMNPHTLGFLTLVFFLAFSAVDFQGTPDHFPMLLFASMGAGHLLSKGVDGLAPSATSISKSVLVFAFAIIFMISGTGLLRESTPLDRQIKVIESIESVIGADAPVATIGLPPFIALSNRTNPNRYLLISGGVGAYIHSQHPNGIDGFLNELEAYDPAVIAFGNTNRAYSDEVIAWLEANYEFCRVPPWRFYMDAATCEAVLAVHNAG